jgi:hypothetical protein
LFAITFIRNSKAYCSESATTATALSAGRVGGDGGNILNATNLEAITGKSTDGRLGTGSGGLGENTTLSTELDVDSVDANSLELTADINGSQHGSVGGGLFSVSLDLHTTGDTGVGFTAGEIGNVDEGVVLGGLDVANTEGVVISTVGTTDLGGTVVGHGLLFLGFDILSLLSLGDFGLK